MQDFPSTRPRSPVSSRPRHLPSPTRGILPWPKCNCFSIWLQTIVHDLSKRRIYMVALSCNPKDCKHSCTTTPAPLQNELLSHNFSLTKKHCGFPVIYYYMSTQNIHEACYSKFTNFDLQHSKMLKSYLLSSP